MRWLQRKGSGNELGEYLPDGEAQLTEASECIQANSLPEAKKKCEELADEYNGVDAKVEPIGKKLFDCQFKLWS